MSHVSTRRRVSTSRACKLAKSLHPGTRVSATLLMDRASGDGQVEELAAAAVKEEGIEVKLAALTAQWAVLSLTFLDYKTRGPVLLKVR